MTLQNELLNKILMKQYGDEIKELKVYLLEDIKVKVKETEARIIESATLSMKRVEANAGYLKKLNELTRKIEKDILNVAVDIIEDYSLVDFTVASKIKTFDDYLQYKRDLNKETKFHDTEKDDLEQLTDMLFKASKVLGTTVISGDTTVVDAQKISDAIRKMMESKDFKLF